MKVEKSWMIPGTVKTQNGLTSYKGAYIARDKERTEICVMTAFQYSFERSQDISIESAKRLILDYLSFVLSGAPPIKEKHHEIHWPAIKKNHDEDIRLANQLKVMLGEYQLTGESL